MSGTPKWKIYNSSGEYVAACKYPEDAAAIASINEGGRVKWDHKLVVWEEGKEAFLASESYDRAAEVMRERYERRPAWRPPTSAKPSRGV